MTYLLDTHILLWFLQDSKKLKQKAREIIQNEENELRLSVISLIEISIKLQIGKLCLEIPENQIIHEAKRAGIQLIPLLPVHSYSFANMKKKINDPFDKLLLATALAGPIYFLTADKKLHGLSDLIIAV